MVERRKASAPCKARAASQDAEVADLRLSAFCLPSILFPSLSVWTTAPGRQPGPPPVPSDEDRGSDIRSWRWLGKARAKIMRRENEIACIIRPRDSGRGTTGLAKRSEPWWRGRGPRRFSFVEKEFRPSSAPPPPPCFAGTADASRRRSLRKSMGGRRPPMAPFPAIAVADEAPVRLGPGALDGLEPA